MTLACKGAGHRLSVADAYFDLMQDNLPDDWTRRAAKLGERIDPLCGHKLLPGGP